MSFHSMEDLSGFSVRAYGRQNNVEKKENLVVVEIDKGRLIMTMSHKLWNALLSNTSALWCASLLQRRH